MNHRPIRHALATTLIVVTAAFASATCAAPATVAKVSLSRGLVMVSVLKGNDGDRENVVTVEEHDSRGATYRWNTRLPDANGKSRTLRFRRHVRAVDLEKATRLHSVYWPDDQTDYSGYTGWSISTAVYDALIEKGEAQFTIVTLPEGEDAATDIVGGLTRSTARLRGTLRLASKDPQPFPILFNGERVVIPSLALSGRLDSGGVPTAVEMRVVADRQHPLILKSVRGRDTWQMVRLETPQSPARTLEQSLARDCHVELSGIYFGFANAELDDRSQLTLAAVAQVLARNPSWIIAVEGHTDDVGSDAANQKLSRARADAVLESLTVRHSLPASRLSAAGFGKSRPRESNLTFEGRARNRRVELVRACGAGES